MVQAIKFAVRNSAGGVVQGTAGGSGSNFIQVGSGEQVSLHLAHSSVVGYERKGADLIVKLVDGQTVDLAGFFDADPGRVNRLYLSADGEVSEVLLQDSGANGVIYASYGPVDAWNKFSTLDDIRFAEADNYAAAEMVSDEPAGMGFLAPGLLGGGLGAGALAAGLIGGAALLGGGGGNGTDGTGDGDGDGDGDG
ncbi:BapA/Bap/LapF family prefix-like domain-containing protein, partial [Gemmobacter nanjingensis]